MKYIEQANLTESDVITLFFSGLSISNIVDKINLRVKATKRNIRTEVETAIANYYRNERGKNEKMVDK